MTSRFQTREKIQAAVITGGHNFDVPAFHELFRSITEIDFYIQDLDNFAGDMGKVRDAYDVLLFYNMHMQTPEGRVKEALEQIGESKQGLFVLHHAILAFPDWQLWSDICGIQNRHFGVDIGQTLHVEIAEPQHPITSGLTCWGMVDETYTMKDAGEGCEVLLTTDHPKSMKTLGWVREYKNARVFCYQSGHDNQTYANPQFRTVVARGIQWVAGKI